MVVINVIKSTRHVEDGITSESYIDLFSIIIVKYMRLYLYCKVFVSLDEIHEYSSNCYFMHCFVGAKQKNNLSLLTITIEFLLAFLLATAFCQQNLCFYWK